MFNQKNIKEMQVLSGILSEATKNADVKKKNEMEESIRIMLIPSDPEDGKNSIVEIRAGTGGDEASIFAGDLYRMYTRFCENKKWKIELVDCTEGTVTVDFVI